MSGHGHVTPNADGVKARCGGPHLCGDCARELMETGQPMHTGLRLSLNCEDWDVTPDLKYDEALEGFVYARTTDSHGMKVPVARLRRIGWLDQRGQVWLKVPDGATADRYRCGSFTPLLIDPGERDGS